MDCCDGLAWLGDNGAVAPTLRRHATKTRSIEIQRHALIQAPKWDHAIVYPSPLVCRPNSYSTEISQPKTWFSSSSIPHEFVETNRSFVGRRLLTVADLDDLDGGF